MFLVCIQTVIRVGIVRFCVSIVHRHVCQCRQRIEARWHQLQRHRPLFSSLLMLCLSMASDETIHQHSEQTVIFACVGIFIGTTNFFLLNLLGDPKAITSDILYDNRNVDFDFLLSRPQHVYKV